MRGVRRLATIASFGAVPFAILASMSLAGCNNSHNEAVTVPGEVPGRPEIMEEITVGNVMEVGRHGECDSQTPNGLSPNEYEFENFRERIDYKNGLVNFPIDIKCLASKYNIREAKKWRAAGDPVAAYILLYKQYPGLHAVCKNFAEFDKEVKRIGAVESTISVNGRPIRRVPEVFYVAMYTDALCGGHLPKMNFQILKASGFDPAPMSWPYFRE